MSSANYEEQIKTANSELASLGRVSHRLAMVDTTDRLTQVLDKLLPRLLKRIGENHNQKINLPKNDAPSKLISVLDQIHAKLVEMLSHTLKRVRDDKGCGLPCKAILELFVTEQKQEDDETSSLLLNSSIDALTLNLSLMFLTIGVPRCNSTELAELLPSLLICQSHCITYKHLENASKKSQASQMAHLLLRCIELLVQSDKSYSSIMQQRTKTTQVNTNSSTDNTANIEKSEPSPISTCIMKAREICRLQPNVASAVYDLLLDAILYQPMPVGSTIPPSGLSQYGNERLISGNSTTARDWAAEMAPRNRLVQFKLAMLDFISPVRQWGIFLSSSYAAASEIDTKTAPANGHWDRVGVARTVALLVAASGDPSTEVSERASTYLKSHLESYRGDDYKSAKGLGQALPLATGLLSLCLGQTHAESALSKVSDRATQTNSNNIAPHDFFEVNRVTSTKQEPTQQVILSTKRRPVSEYTSGAIVSFVSSKVLEEYPHLLENSLEETDDNSESSSTNVFVHALGTVAVQASGKTLGSMESSSGMTTLRAKPFISAAQLLNALAVRLTLHYDTSSNDEKALEDLMAQSLSIVCSVIAPVSSQGSQNSTIGTRNDGSVAVRDACYGVICTLSRSQFALIPGGYIFNKGARSESSDGTMLLVSVETASLLFGCAAFELELLRPRAVAALDALLGAYCRAYTQEISMQLYAADALPDTEVTPSEATLNDANNPWLQMSTPKSPTESTTSPSSGNSLKVNKDALAKALLPLIWSAAQIHRMKASRVAAARWASELFKELDLTSACHMLCFLAGDTDVTAASIAREGLGISKLTPDDDSVPSYSNESSSLPDFGDFAKILFSKPSQPSGLSSKLQRYQDFSFQGKAATLRFGIICLLNDLYGGEDQAVGLYLSALRETLAFFAKESNAEFINSESPKGGSSIDLLDECSLCLLTIVSSSQFARTELVKTPETFSIAEMKHLCFNCTSSRARRHLAAACRRLFEDTTIWQSRNGNGDDLSDWVASSEIDKALADCAQICAHQNTSAMSLGRFHGSAFLGAQLIRVFRLQSLQKVSSSGIVEKCWEYAAKILAVLGEGVLNAEEAIGNACTDGLAIAFSYESVDAPLLDKKLYQCTSSILSNLASGLSKFGHSDTMNVSRATKITRASGVCLAASTTGSGVVDVDEQGQKINLGPARLRCIDSLFSILGSMAYRKEEEIAIVVGEALADYSDAFSPKNAVWSSGEGEWPSDYDEEKEKEMPPHEQVLFVLLRKVFAASNPQTKTACAPALLAVVARGSRKLNVDKSYASRSLVKSLMKHLEEIQKVFIFLLSNPKSKQFGRESCCLGLAACRGLLKNIDSNSNSHQENHYRLLKAFGQTTNFGGSAMMETQAQAAARRAAEANADANAAVEDVQPDAEVGGASGMSESALGAYREMAAASVSLGRDDVLYSLLILSVSHVYWNSAEARDRYGSSSLLGEDSAIGNKTNAIELRKVLRPHLGKLLPRILRACHDPNKQTREQMSSLWVGLTGGGAEGRQAITNNLLSTIDTLLEDASSKFWRARVGACGALSEIVVGREWSALGGGGPVLSDDYMFDGSTASAGSRLLRLWRIAMRALDDVRGAVREIGGTLARAVRSLTIRLCDPAATDKASGAKRGRDEKAKRERDAYAAAATSLRWLIKYGLNQTCDEATGACISTLVEVVGVVSPKILEPILPDLLRSLLVAMSGLEPAALNYMQLRSTDQEGLERARLQLAQTGPLAAAVTKCLELLPSVGLETQRKIAPELDAALRMSTGFATRAAVADSVSTLCSTCPSVFRFSGSSSANPAVRLLRAFYFASERERGSGSKDKMIDALGNLAALCPGSSVRALALRACDRYRSSTGNNDDPTSRRAAAAALRAIAVRASSQFADGGKNDVWGRRVLPAAYIGRKDADAKIASMWNEVWEEGGSAAMLSSETSVIKFGTSLEENLLSFLVRECTFALEDVSWARRVAGSSALIDLSDRGVLSPIPRNSNSASNDVTGNMARAKNRAEACNNAINACIQLLAKPRLWDGKSEVLKAVVKVASKWVAAEAASEIDEINLFGWDKPDKVCPWRPLVYAPGDYGDDLFIGDHWFSTESMQDSMEEEEKEQIKTETMETDANDKEKINFEEMDEGNEEEDQIQDDEAVTDSFSIVTFSGLCRFINSQAFPKKQNETLSEELLPYRTTAFRSFRDLMNSLPPEETTQRIEIFNQVAPKLVGLSKGDSETKAAPVLVAGAIDCLGACFWQGCGSKQNDTPHMNPEELTTSLKEVGGKTQPAWTVRESSALCLSHFAAKCHIDAIRQPAVVAGMVNAASFSLTDRKFWRVRFAGLKLLESLTARAGTAHDKSPNFNEKQLILESLLPHKEDIIKLLRKTLSDSESKITALSSNVLASMSWWP